MSDDADPIAFLPTRYAARGDFPRHVDSAAAGAPIPEQSGPLTGEQALAIARRRLREWIESR